MAEDPKVAIARANAAQARARLLRSAHHLGDRVSPSRIAGDVVAGARDRGAEALDQATAVAKRRPRLVAGLVATLAAVLLRRPIARRLRRHRPPLPAPAQAALPRPTGAK